MIESDGFRCGWNDIAYGINNWTSCERWSGPLAWVLHIKEICADLPHRSGDYVRGCVACANEFQRAGNVSRKTRDADLPNQFHGRKL